MKFPPYPERPEDSADDGADADGCNEAGDVVLEVSLLPVVGRVLETRDSVIDEPAEPGPELLGLVPETGDELELTLDDRVFAVGVELDAAGAGNAVSALERISVTGSWLDTLATAEDSTSSALVSGSVVEPASVPCRGTRTLKSGIPPTTGSRVCGARISSF